MKEALRVIEDARLNKGQVPQIAGSTPTGSNVAVSPPRLSPSEPVPTPKPRPGSCVQPRTSIMRDFADIGNLSAAGTTHLGDDKQWANACGLRCAATEKCEMWTYCKTCQACWLYSGGDTTPAPPEYERWSGSRGCVNPLVPPLGFARASNEGFWSNAGREIEADGEKDMTIAACGARCAGRMPRKCAAFSMLLTRPSEGMGRCFHYEEDTLDEPFTPQRNSWVFVRGSVRQKREVMQHPMHQMLSQLFGGHPVQVVHSHPGDGFQWHPLQRFFQQSGGDDW